MGGGGNGVGALEGEDLGFVVLDGAKEGVVVGGAGVRAHHCLRPALLRPAQDDLRRLAGIRPRQPVEPIVIEVGLNALNIPHSKGGTEAAIEWLGESVSP